MKKEETGSPNSINYSIWETRTKDNQPNTKETSMAGNDKLTNSQSIDDDRAWEDDRL